MKVESIYLSDPQASSFEAPASTVKHLRLDGDAAILLPENEKYQPITTHNGADFEVWGVAMNAIHNLRK
jgi:SOS-response transcriptional repressor LexA